MSYDIGAARAAGLSDRQIIDYLSQDRGYDVAGALQAGLSESQIATHMAGMDVDDTSLLGSIGEAARRIPGGLARGITSAFTGAGQLIPGLDDDALVDTQREIDQYIRDTLNYNPDYDDSNVAAIGEGLGQIGSFVIPGLGAAKLAAAGKVAQRAITSGVAASQSLALGAEERRQAEDRGIEISEGQEALSKASDIAIGALETFGMPFRVLRGLPKDWENTPQGSVLMQRLRSALKGAGREGIQEVVSSVARDMSALAIYDPERPIGESAADEFIVGAGAGGIFDFAFSLATGRYKRKGPPDPKEITEPTEGEAAEELRLREAQEVERERRRQAGIDAGEPASDLEQLEEGPPTPELAARIQQEGVQIPDRSEQARQQYLYGLDLDQPQYELNIDASDAQTITDRIASRLSDRLPLGMEFDATSETIRVDDPTAESGFRQVGPRIRDEQKRQEVANRLTETSRRLKQDAETEYRITEAGVEYNPRQVEEIRRLGRDLPSTEARVLTADEINEATGTSRTGTPDADLKDMSVAQLEELDIPRNRWTMTQRINAARLQRNLPEVRLFTLSELKAQNKGRIGNLGTALANKDVELSAFPERTAPDTGAPIDPNRPRQPVTPVGRRASLEYEAKTFDNVLASNKAFERLLSTKQMDITLGSQEMRGLIKQVTGKTPAKKDPLENLTPQERQYLYHSIRRMRRFTDPTQIPDFSSLVPDGEAVRVLRNRVEKGQTGGLGVVADAMLGGTMDTPTPRAAVDRAVTEAERTARTVERSDAPPIPEGQGLVAYDPEATELAQKLRQMLISFGVSDRFSTRLVDRVGRVEYDAQGNVIIEPDPELVDDGEGVEFVTPGRIDPIAGVIQVGLDLVRQKVEKGGQSYEQAVAEVMSHEIVHALRFMDLFTAQEFSLLERMSRKYGKPGTGGTYANWASGLYKDLDAVRVQEEAIAEMISDALTDGVIIDGKQTKPTGKIRQLIKKIVDMFKSIAGFGQDADIQTFTDLVERIRSGEVGGRERGVVRTPVLTEKLTEAGLQAAAERGITKEQLAYRDTPIAGVRGVGDTARASRPDQPEVDESMSSRRAVGAPLTAAIQRAQDKYNNVRIATEEDFFGRYWPQLIAEVGGTVSPQKIRVGAKRAMRDIREWIEQNPKFSDYYNADMQATRASLENEYGPITDGEFALYMFLNGVNSPGTSLTANVGDAINTFDLYRRDGNFNAIKMGLSDKGNQVISQSPFSISGLTAPGKARAMKAFDQIVREKGSIEAAFEHLFEPVTMKELETFKKGLGYTGVGQKGDIRGLVQEATGQQELIPRMFFLGPKLGAYTLNLMGDNRYQTVDVWESRFIRSYFDNMFDTNTGITASAEEGRLFRDFAKVFSEEFEKAAGYKADPASLQAMRWFYMINAAKEAGYSGASTNATISELTERQIENTRATRYGGRQASDQALRVGEQTETQATEIDAPASSRRSLDPAQVEKAVQENIAQAESSGVNVPRYSVKASPEAQYIARNPDVAMPIDEPSESREPTYSTQAQGVISRLTADRPERANPMTEFMEATGETSGLSYQLTKAKQATVNRYARLEQLNKKFFNDYLADTSSIAAVLFADRSRGVTSEAIKSGVPVYRDGLTQIVDFEHNGKKYRGLIDIVNLLMTKEHGDLTQLAQTYAIAMRGQRLNDDGSKTPVTEKDVQDVKAAVAEFTDADGNNPITEWYEVWQAYNNQVIKFLEDTGVISGEVSDNWREASDYIPFYRAMDPDANIGKITKGAFGGLTQAGSFIPYKGSEDAINVPLVEAIVKNVSAAIDMGMRNVAQQRIARDLQKIQLAKQIPTKAQSDYPTVDLKVNGNTVRFEIYDPLLFESMKSIDSSGVENFSRMYFGPFSNILRESVTRSPGFMIANMIRDTLSAFVTSGSNFIPVYDTAKQFFGDINSLERTGVVGGYDFSVGRTTLTGDDNIQKAFSREMERRNTSGLPLNMFSAMWNGLGALTTRSDAATRKAVFDDVYARTGNLAEAHFQAMEVLNFSRRGSNPVMRAITAAIPFLNARIQGLDVLYRGSVGANNANREFDKSRAALSFAMRGMMISAVTAMYWMMVSDEEEYKEASREVRDNNWLIPLGEGLPILKIPIPFEVGLIFKTFPEVFMDTTWGDRTGRQAFQTIKQGVSSTLEFNPVFGIQAIAPVLEAAVNYNSYTGRPVTPVWMAGLLPEEQKTEYTSELGQFIGDSLNISPMKIDHVLKGYTGTLGMYTLDWTDRIVRDPDVAASLKQMGVNITSPEFPAAAAYDLPVIRRFLTSPEGSGLREEFYDLYNEVRQTYNSINKLKKEGRYEELEELIAKRGTLLDVKGGVYSLKNQLDKVRRQKRAIMQSDLDAEEKRKRITELEEYENSMLVVVPEMEKVAERPVTRLFQ